MEEDNEKLRAQLAELERQYAVERIQWADASLGWALGMQEMEADLRALAEAVEMHRTHGHSCNNCGYCESRLDNVLARPGVRRLLAPGGS